MNPELFFLQPLDILGAGDKADLPSEILISPWGEVRSANGAFVMDDEGAASVVAEFKKRGNDLPIDYEHQTMGGELSSPDGTAPAAGWIKELFVKPGVGLFAKVNWTERAATMLAAHEYRYLSPVLLVNKETKRAHVLHSAALTNTPAIEQMVAIVNAANDLAGSDDIWQSLTYFLNLPTTATKGVIMDELQKLLGQLRDIAGVEATVDQPAVLKALTAMKEDLATKTAGAGLLVRVCKTLGVDPADDKAVDAKLLEISKPPTHTESEHETLVNRVNELEGREKERQAEALVEQGFKDGKLSDPLRGWAINSAKENPEAFAEFLKNAQPVVKTGQTTPPGKGAGGDATRETIINKATREYDGESQLQTLTSRAAFIDGELRDNKKTPLTKEERTKLEVAA